MYNDPPRLSSGDTAAGHTVVRLIGSGSQAEVYELQGPSGERLAMKLLRHRLPSMQQRLMSEARAQGRIDHPNVARILDLVTIDSDIGVILEFIDGPTLADWLVERDRTLEEVLSVFRDLLHGVDAAHAAGLVHRDIKPGNVLLHIEGTKVTPKLIDFGIVRDEFQDERVTQTGSTLGSPRYMSPEQLRDAKRIDRRSDLFSLGVLLYEMTTGQHAFDGSHIIAIMNRVVNCNYVPPEEHRPELPKHVVATIKALLVEDRKERLQACRDVETHLYGQSTLTTQFTPVGPPSADETWVDLPNTLNGPATHDRPQSSEAPRHADPSVAALWALFVMAVLAGVVLGRFVL